MGRRSYGTNWDSVRQRNMKPEKGQTYYRNGTGEPSVVVELYTHHGKPCVGYKPRGLDMTYGMSVEMFTKAFTENPPVARASANQ
jgi:hypothetical protein